MHSGSHPFVEEMGQTHPLPEFYMYTKTHVQALMLIFIPQLVHKILTLTPQKQCKPPTIQPIISQETACF